MVPGGGDMDMGCGEGLREKLMEWRPMEESGLLPFGLFAKGLTMWLLLLLLLLSLPLTFPSILRAGGLSARAASGLTVRIVLLKGFG